MQRRDAQIGSLYNLRDNLPPKSMSGQVELVPRVSIQVDVLKKDSLEKKCFLCGFTL